jgi:hypothetical protein
MRSVFLANRECYQPNIRAMKVLKGCGNSRRGISSKEGPGSETMHQDLRFVSKDSTRPPSEEGPPVVFEQHGTGKGD